MRKFLKEFITHRVVKKISPFLKNNKKTVLTLLLVFILGDVFFVDTSSDFVILGILLLYAIFIKIFRISSKLTFLLCFGLLATMSVNYLLTQASISTEKLAVWFILFLIIGTIQQWLE